MLVRIKGLAALIAAAFYVTAAGAQTADLDPTTPLAPLPDLGVAWPDLNVRDPLETAPDASAAPVNETPRYAVSVVGIDELPKAREQFQALSVLRKNDGDPANAAQIDRRARDDVELLTTIMRSEGYYDATIESEIKPAIANEPVLVTLTVTPGAQYKFTDVQVVGLPPDKKRYLDAYGVAPDAPVVAEDVIAGQAALIDKLTRTGYPFAKVGEPSVLVDREARDAKLDLNVTTGGKRNFGSIRMEAGKPPFDTRHAEVISRWTPGDLYDASLLDDYRRAIVATGLVSQVRATPVEGQVPGTVDIATTLDPAPFRTIAGEAGYGTGEGIRAEVSWQHRNLIQPEGAVTLRAIAGTREQLAGATLRMGNFRRRDQVLNARILFNHDNRAAYDSYAFELAGSIERQTTIIWQKPWAYSLGAEIRLSSERSLLTARNANVRREFYTFALPGTLAYDGSNSLLDPTTGYRVSGRVSPEFSLSGRAFGYVRAQLDASYYQPVGERLTVAGRVRLGGIVGAGRETIAPSRLFYAGGGGSVRGYGYQLIGPRNAADEPIGGRSLVEASLEARVRLPYFGGNFGVVPFIDVGNIYPSTLPGVSGLRVGAGLGLRYYSNFGPIRIDVGTPIGRRRGEAPIAIQVSLGQAF